jgi:hypothetical protein
MSVKEKYYRTISARFPQMLGGLALLALIFFTFSLSVVLIKVHSEYKKEASYNLETKNKYEYWKSIMHKHPEFPIAYYETAIYALRLDRKEEARVLLHHALLLDPDFAQAEKLKNQIGN